MIKKLRVTVDGKSYEVTVEVPDESGSAAAAPPPPVSAPAASSQSAPSQPVPSHSAPVVKTGGGPGAVLSPLAGRVIAIIVKPGQEVKAGDHLLTLEAMKMNTVVSAPRAGKVAEILTTVGSAVDEGQILVRIED
ncbi:MAG: biotin/lipoyl-containing protein [Limisphaerales bacterium]